MQSEVCYPYRVMCFVADRFQHDQIATLRNIQAHSENLMVKIYAHDGILANPIGSHYTIQEVTGKITRYFDKFLSHYPRTHRLALTSIYPPEKYNGRKAPQDANCFMSGVDNAPKRGPFQVFHGVPRTGSISWPNFFEYVPFPVPAAMY